MPATLAVAFAEQYTVTALLREYAFISQGLHHLREEVARHRIERDTIFRTLMTSRPFQETMSPILQIFRQRREEENLPSYGSPSPEPI
jgi:hypothetical protein